MKMKTPDSPASKTLQLLFLSNCDTLACTEDEDEEEKEVEEEEDVSQ